ncbi:MAG: amidohydrolase family protein, partial [Saprospiraceae bacterium]|nr:amidohydrolase family protein [Saprospiraceae bacterium]
NWQLSVLEEMKTISRYKSYLAFDQILRWATLNGARALGFDEDLGSLERGKAPGINLLSMDPANPALDHTVSVTRLV